MFDSINELSGQPIRDPEHWKNKLCFGKDYADQKDLTYGAGIKNEEIHQEIINKLINK
jgi:hypothetical protein